MSAIDALNPRIPLRNTGWGPSLIGLLVTWGLLGVLIHQAQIYYTLYRDKDRMAIQLTVYGVVLSEIAFTGILTHSVYTGVIYGCGDPCLSVPWSGGMIVPSSACISVVVQIFFAWRIWLFGSNFSAFWTRCATALILVLSLLHFSAAMAYTAQYATHGELTPIPAVSLPKLTPLIIIWLTSASTTDLLISVVLVASLLSSRHGDMPRNTLSTLNRLIIRAVETGIVTTVINVAALFLYVAPATHAGPYYAGVMLCLGKFYSNMLLANLNGRNSIARPTGNDVQVIELGSAAEFQAAIRRESMLDGHQSGAEERSDVNKRGVAGYPI